MPDVPLVAVSGLTKQYGATLAVDDVSFTLNQGATLGILGESGSGKTTLARLLMGLERPTSGTIEILGQRRSVAPRNAPERRARARDLQLLFQDPYASLDRRQTTRQCIDEVLRLHRSLDRPARRVRIQQLADLVGLDARILDTRPRQLSGGQRQRVAIARALAAEPRGLILDEAVAALDVSVQAQVLNVLKDIREETNIAYLIISHDLAVIRFSAAEVVVMRRGTIVERGATAEVLTHPRHPYTQLLRASVPRPGWRPERSQDAPGWPRAPRSHVPAPAVETTGPQPT